MRTKAEFARNRRRIEAAMRRDRNSLYAPTPPHRREAAERECRALGIDPNGTDGWPL